MDSRVAINDSTYLKCTSTVDRNARGRLLDEPQHVKSADDMGKSRPVCNPAQPSLPDLSRFGCPPQFSMWVDGRSEDGPSRIFFEPTRGIMCSVPWSDDTMAYRGPCVSVWEQQQVCSTCRMEGQRAKIDTSQIGISSVQADT